MKFELIGKIFKYEDKKGVEREGVNYFLRRDDGYEIQISKYVHTYTNKDGKEITIDTTREMLALATLERKD